MYVAGGWNVEGEPVCAAYGRDVADMCGGMGGCCGKVKAVVLDGVVCEGTDESGVSERSTVGADLGGEHSQRLDEGDGETGPVRCIDRGGGASRLNPVAGADLRNLDSSPCGGRARRCVLSYIPHSDMSAFVSAVFHDLHCDADRKEGRGR